MKRIFFSRMVLATPLAAHDQIAGDLHIIHPSPPAPAASANSTAGYVTISNEGDMIPATLIFRQAGDVAVEFMVDPADGAGQSTMDHSGH